MCCKAWHKDCKGRSRQPSTTAGSAQCQRWEYCQVLAILLRRSVTTQKRVYSYQVVENITYQSGMLASRARPSGRPPLSGTCSTQQQWAQAHTPADGLALFPICGNFNSPSWPASPPTDLKPAEPLVCRLLLCPLSAQHLQPATSHTLRAF